MGVRNAINAAVGLLFIVSVGFGVYLLTRAIWGGFTSLETGTASAVAAAAGAVLLAIVNLVAQKYVDRRRDIEARQRERKIKVYQRFLKFWFEFLLSPENRKARAQGRQNVEEVAPELNDITQQLILWASDSTLKAHSDFRRLLSDTKRKPRPTEVMLKFERLLYQIRKDLGHNNRSLKERDVLALFINDVDEIDSSSGVKPS